MPKIEALKSRLGELRLVKEQARILHNLLFDARLIDEQMISHKLLSDLDMRIEQLENFIERIRKNPDSALS